MSLHRPYSLSRRKIRLDRGDTLGGTVPLTMRDHVQPDAGYGQRRFGIRRRHRGGGFWSWTLTILLALILAAAIGIGLGAIGGGEGGLLSGFAPDANPAEDASGLIDRLREYLGG